MKDMLKRAAITSLVICAAGSILNLMTYYMYNSLFLAVNVKGEDARRGMGMILRSTGLSFNAGSFITPLVILFLGALIIEWRKYVIIKKMVQGPEEEGKG